MPNENNQGKSRAKPSAYNRHVRKRGGARGRSASVDQSRKTAETSKAAGVEDKTDSELLSSMGSRRARTAPDPAEKKNGRKKKAGSKKAAKKKAPVKKKTARNTVRRPTSRGTR